MESAKVSSSYQGHRGACDQCSQRKVRCTVGNGACQNCISWGRTCTYSPRIPSGRPRKKAASTASDAVTSKPRQNGRHASKASPPNATGSLTLPLQEVPPALTRSSASVSSMESQLITPPTEIRENNFEYDPSCNTLSNNLYDDTMMFQTDYAFPSLQEDQTFTDQTFADYMFQTSAQYTDLQFVDATTMPQMNAQRPSSSFTLSRRNSNESNQFNFTSLLTDVMELRRNHDNLKSYTSSPDNVNQFNIVSIVDQAVATVGQYLDDIEPYLSLSHRTLETANHGARNKQTNDLQKTIHIIVAGFSIVVESAYALHELLLSVCRNESIRVTARLNIVLQFSTIDFHIRRCLHSLSLVTDILATDGLESLTLDNIQYDLNTAQNSGNSLRNELAAAIEELKTPVF